MCEEVRGVLQWIADKTKGALNGDGVESTRG
jgi:hypothetical protein